MPNACSGKVGTLQKKATAEAGPSIQVFTAATPAASSAPAATAPAATEPAATAPAALPSSGDRNKKLAMIGGGVILALAGFYLWSKK
jgi:LPXTG-motif cell wall-anchored protein